MKQSLTNNSVKCHLDGFTLIEVTAALAILSMVVLASLHAQQKIQRQMALTSQRTQAIEKLDLLLKSWVNGNKWPDVDSGPMPGMAGYEWRRSTLSAPLPANVQLVEIKVIEPGSNEQPRTICRVQAFKSKN